MSPNSLITLTTDFGLADHFVGAMKGVIYGINPAANVVDISHAVQSYDILDGALTLAQVYGFFPAGTIHVVVVDPGVGSSRRPILASTARYFFVAPDNGVLSLVYEREERVSVRHITAEHYFQQPVSQTFHGRDIFAAVAVWLSKGVEPSNFGEEVSDYVRFAAPKPKRLEDGSLKGVVLKVDKFGNLVTNFTAADAAELLRHPAPSFKIAGGRQEVTTLRSAYAEGAPGEVFAILGSMGYLELSANRGAAAQILGLGKGAEVLLQVKSGK